MRLRTDLAQVKACSSSDAIGPVPVFLGFSLCDELTVRAVAGPTQLTFIDPPPKPGLAPVRTEADPTEVSESRTVKAIRYLLDEAGTPQVGLSLEYSRQIPRVTGLGAETVETLLGLLAARDLLGAPPEIDQHVINRFGSHLGARPPQLIASLLGGIAIAGPPTGDDDVMPLVLHLEAHPHLEPTVLVPQVDQSRENNLTTMQTSSKRMVGQDVLDAGAALVPLLSAGTQLALEHSEWKNALLRVLQTISGHSEPERQRPATTLAAWLLDQKIPAFPAGEGDSVIALTPLELEVLRATQKSGWHALPLRVRSVSRVRSAPTYGEN